MKRLPVPLTMHVEILMSVLGQKVENGFHVTLLANPTLGDAIVLAEDIVDWLEAYGVQLLVPQVTILGLKITNIHDPDGFQLEYTTGFPMVGTATGTVAPLNVTAAVRLTTAARGKSTTGRIFATGLPTVATNGNQITPTWMGYLKTGYEALIAAVNITDRFMTVASYIHDGEPRSTPITTHITGVQVEENLDSQRRRLTGRGK